MYRPDPSWGHDPLTLSLYLRNLVLDISWRDEESTESVLDRLLSAGWPSRFAQDQ